VASLRVALQENAKRYRARSLAPEDWVWQEARRLEELRERLYGTASVVITYQED
jgi:hypothetical protein